MVKAAGSGPVWADKKNRYSSKPAVRRWCRARNSRSRRSIGCNSAALSALKSPRRWTARDFHIGSERRSGADRRRHRDCEA
jgi:hypothetical protein